MVVQVVVRRQMQAVAPIFIQNLQISRVNRCVAAILQNFPFRFIESV